MRQEQWDVLAIYQKLISSSELLAKGQTYLEEVINSVPQFCTISISLISESTVIDRQTSNYIASLIKNLLIHNWDSNQIILAEKDSIRQECIAGATKAINNVNIQSNLAELISFFLQRDGIDLWKESLKALIKSTLCESTLDFYCLIFSKVDYRINVLVPTLLPALLPVLHSTESRVTRQKCLILYYLAILSFSFAENADDDLVHECLDSTYSQYITIFLHILTSDQLQFFPHQIIVFKIFREFFQDFPQYSEGTFKSSFMNLIGYLHKAISINYELSLSPYASQQQQQPQQQQQQQNESALLDEVIEKYLPDTFEAEGDNACSLLIYECLCFVDVILFMDSAEQLVQFLIYPVLNILSSLLFVDKHMEQTVCADPNHFVVCDRNPDDEVTSLRGKFIQTVNNILETESFKSVCLVSLLKIADSSFRPTAASSTQTVAPGSSSTSSLTQLSSYISHNDLQMIPQPTEDEFIELSSIVDHFTLESFTQLVCFSSLPSDKEIPDWKKKELALFILGSFADQIANAQSNSLEFLKNLLGEFSFAFTEIARNPMLISRYFECFGAFANTIIQSFDYISILEQALLFVFINESNQATRIIALECLSRIIQSENSRSSNSTQPHILSAFNEIQPSNPSTAAATTAAAEQITRNFVNTIDQSSKEILPHILSSLAIILRKAQGLQPCFMRVAVSTLQNLVNYFGGEAEIQPNVIKVIEVIASSRTNYDTISAAFTPLISSCFNVLNNYFLSHSDLNKIKQNDINTIQNSVSIMKILVIYKQTTTPIFAECVSTLLRLLYSNEDITLQQEATLCLKSIAIYQPESLISNKEDLRQLYIKLLSNIDSQPEAFSQYLPSLILMSQGVVDIDRIQMSKIIESIAKCDSYSLNISQLIFVSSLLEKNSAETLSFLISYRLEIDETLCGFEVFFEKLRTIMYQVKSDLIKAALSTPLAKALLLNEAIAAACAFTENDGSASFNVFCLLSKFLERELAPDQCTAEQITNDSDAEVEANIIQDIRNIHPHLVHTSTKQVLTEFFQAFYLNNPMVFQNLLHLMDFDEKIAIETVLEPHLRQIAQAP